MDIFIMPSAKNGNSYVGFDMYTNNSGISQSLYLLLLVSK